MTDHVPDPFGGSALGTTIEATGEEAGFVPRLSRRADVVWRRVHGSTLLRPRRGDLLYLSGTGPAVWEELAEPRTLAAVAEELARRYATDPAAVASDLAPIVEELVEAGVLCWT